jgi:hypothetical protein
MSLSIGVEKVKIARFLSVVRIGYSSHFNQQQKTYLLILIYAVHPFDVMYYVNPFIFIRNKSHVMSSQGFSTLEKNAARAVLSIQSSSTARMLQIKKAI